jgi:hypothetical protein
MASCKLATAPLSFAVASPTCKPFEDMRWGTLIFYTDDTLVVEEALAEAASMATCQFAFTRIGAESVQLCQSIRESCRDSCYDSPIHLYCLDVRISSREGLWAEFDGKHFFKISFHFDLVSKFPIKIRVEKYEISYISKMYREHGSGIYSQLCPGRVCVCEQLG